MDQAMADIGGTTPRITARSGLASGLMLASAVSLLALPSAVLAFSSRLVTAPDALDADVLDSGGGIQLAESDALSRSLVGNHGFHFTPAGTPTRPDRSITVAVRVDPAVAREIIVRGPSPMRGGSARIAAAEPAQSPLQLAPSAFNLGVSRGYQSFAQPAVTPKTDLARIEMPDLSRFPKSGAGGGSNSRLAPRITLDDHAPAGRAPRTFAGDPEDRVDVGGSLRVTRNLNVTAGVRYSERDRDRLRPLTDGKQDDQAVYVGTQFRF